VSSAVVDQVDPRADEAKDGSPTRPTMRQATEALRYREFRLFFLAALASNTGGWMQSAAVPYVAFQLTGRNGGVGITGFFQYLPLMLMGAAGGLLADRFDRRRLLLIAQVFQALFAVALWALVASGRTTTVSLAGLAFLAGLAGGLNVPIWQSFVSQLVPRDVLVNAITLNSTQFNAARALGTFLAGIVIAISGPSLVFLINAVSFVAVLIVLLIIRPIQAQPTRSDPPPKVLADLAAGWRYVRNAPGIVSCCVAIIAIGLLCAPLFAFLTASYGQEIFDVTGWRLGLLWGAGGIGAVMLAPVLLTRGVAMSRRSLLIIAMTTYGFATSAVGLAPTWWLAAIASIAYGAAYLAIASALNTTIQVLASEAMRGKTIAVYLMCLTGALPIGLAVWGFAADAFGIRQVTVVSGVLLVAVTAWLAGSSRLDGMADADVARAAL